MASYAIVPERRVNKAWIVEAMIRLLAGPGVRITFDGAMSRTEEDFGHIPGAVCHNPYYGGSPRWIIPENYCITMPIEDDAVLPSLRSILHRIGIRYQVHHIEIKRGDELLFSTYDRWSDYAGVHGVSEEQLWYLVDQGLLKSFGTVEHHPYRYIPASR